MGCGQSKINLYPRRNKNGGKGHSAKKSGAAEKEADEEEGNTGAAPPDDTEDENHGKHILPLTSHHSTIEVSVSQQDFFKILDEKIEKGRDYDSSSETEVRLEREKRRNLLLLWRSTSQSSQSSIPSPPTRRRYPRPLPPTPERHSPRRTHQSYRNPSMGDGCPPPNSNRTFSAPANGETWHDSNKSPSKRPQSAGPNWKTQYNQKPKKNEANEMQKASQKDGDLSDSSSDVSQITYNPTFQTHSPAHSVKSQQPFITQILSYPTSQQVTPPSPPKYIAPPEEYQDPQNTIDNKYANAQKQSPSAQSAQSNIYYIHGNAPGGNQDLAQQRQQTAIHLQQYVAMKQAQQQMITYLQRGPHTVFPGVPIDYTAPNANRAFEGDEYGPGYVHPAMRPHSAPTPIGVVRPMPGPIATPGFGTHMDGAHMMQMPMWPMPPVVSTMGPWMPGQVPPEAQYYPQSQFVPMYRPHSAGSAGTLTRYHKREPADGEVKNNVCQSINLVRQKPVGQIVNVPGQELTVCSSTSESPSPASVSTDSGVSPGNSAPNSKSSVFSTPSTNSGDTITTTVESKVKKKVLPFNIRSMKNSKSLDS